MNIHQHDNQNDYWSLLSVKVIIDFRKQNKTKQITNIAQVSLHAALNVHNSIK